MMERKRNRLVLTAMICALLLQGCSAGTGGESGSSVTLSTISLNNDASEVTSAIVTFAAAEESTKATENVSDDIEVLDEILLTHNIPQTANVYRVISRDKEIMPCDNPVSSMQMVEFQSFPLMRGDKVYNDDFTESSQLSHENLSGIVDSYTNLDGSEVEKMGAITDAFPDSVWCDYVIRSTFPAVTSDLYQIVSWDATGDVIVADTVMERPLDLYVIRPSVDDIPIGAPYDAGVGYGRYDSDEEREFRIVDEQRYMFYDNESIYEVHADCTNVELYLHEQPILTFEQAIDVAVPTLSELFNESQKNNWETRVYAVELVYLETSESYISNADYYGEGSFTRSSCENYLYPFWVIYTHTNCYVAGTESAYRRSVMVNAVTGEVFYGCFS